MKKLLATLLSIVMLLSLVGCGTQANEPEVPETRTFTDSVGRSVELPAEITKIAVSGPLAQIVLFALAPDKLVGIASEWDETAEKYLDTEYYNLPLLGQLYGG
ncbi:MAG: ABC transporter substrate-binding protein, partial [Oscillospiraceae bacterium]|nr:ABC transporter substrate-binding protein [Oscillospiraceae bacterium]